MSQDLPDVTLEELESSPWKNAINETSNKICIEYFSAFYKEAEKYGENSSECRSCKLLGNLCSIDFTLDEGKEPFIVNKLSFLPQDLSDNHVEVLFKFLSKIQDPELKSRIADILWLKKGNHKFECAQIAFVEYKKPIEKLKGTDNIQAIIRMCRAVNLTYEMGRGGLKQQKEILNDVESYVLDVPIEASFGYHLQLFKILSERKFGDLKKLAVKCSTIADYHEKNNNFHLMRSFLILSYEFIKLSDNTSENLIKIKIREAESYITEAEYADTAMKKSFLYEAAIKAYRNIAGCSNKVDELHAKLISEQLNVTNEMVLFKTHEVDISRLVKEAEQFVSGYDFYDSLARLGSVT